MTNSTGDNSTDDSAIDSNGLISADAVDAQRTTSAPSDNTTLTSVLDGFAGEGYRGDFSSAVGGRLRCSECSTESSAADFAVMSLRRLEGASEPDEMVAVVAAICPNCGASGVAVLAFGPTSSAVDADALVALDRSNI